MCTRMRVGGCVCVGVRACGWVGVCVCVCVCVLIIHLFCMLHYKVILHAFVSVLTEQLSLHFCTFLHFLLLQLLNYQLVNFITS